MHTNSIHLLLAATLACFGAAGCVAHAHGHAHAGVEVDGPDLVLVEPGVWVVERHHHAVYYVDGVYWRYADGVWYRSDYWDGGWIVVGVSVVPHIIVRRDHHHYVNYVGPRYVERRPARAHVRHSPARAHPPGHVKHHPPGHVRHRAEPPGRVKHRDNAPGYVDSPGRVKQRDDDRDRRREEDKRRRQNRGRHRGR
jgi:hypothetical protein